MQRKANIVCRLQTKIHYCSALCHRGWTDERLGQDQEETEGEFAIGGEGIRRREGWEMREKRSEGGGGRSVVCQWEQSEISINLTAACMHASLQLATCYLNPPHRCVLSFVYSSESRTSYRGRMFYLWYWSENGVSSLVWMCACECVTDCRQRNRSIFPVLVIV